MENLDQEIEIAAAETAKLTNQNDPPAEELRRLRRNIDDKRKAMAQAHRLAIKEIDRRFAAPIQALKDKLRELGNKKEH